MANWTSLAFSEVWLPDEQVLGVTPFLLAGGFWEASGWLWVDSSGRRLVYNQTRALRCATVGGVGC